MGNNAMKVKNSVQYWIILQDIKFDVKLSYVLPLHFVTYACSAVHYC